MVGASSDPTKFSYGVLRVLHETGYDMIPVNPNEAGGTIRGLPVYASLAAIDRLTTGPLVLVGSSMGGWMALLVALARRDRVAGVTLLAPAPDFFRGRD